MVIALVAIVALIAWLVGGGGEDAAASPARDPGVEAPGGLPSFTRTETEPPGEALAADSAAAVAPAAQAPAATSTRLIVRVSWALDGSPAADIGLRVLPGARQEISRDNAILGRTDASGTFILDPAPVGRIGVLTDRDGVVFGEIVTGQSTDLSIAIPEATNVVGLVVDRDGTPAPDAEIWLSDRGSTWRGLVVARCGPDGRFKVRDVSGQRWIGARASGRVASPLDEIKKDGPTVAELMFELGGPAVTLRGLVVDNADQPVAGAMVRVGPEGGWRSDDPRHAQEGPPPLSLETSAEGRFVAADIPPDVVLVAVKHAGFSLWSQHVDTDRDLRVVLQPGATLEGTVRDASGAPVEGVRITIGQSPAQMEWVSVTSDAAGRYVLRDPPLGKQQAVASKKDAGEDKSSFVFEAGQAATWDPLITTGSMILGRVIDESGASVEGLSVRTIHSRGFDGWMKSATVAADGRFAVPNCEDTTHTIEVMDRDYSLSLAIVKDIRPGPDEIVIRIPATARQTAGVFGRLVDGQGALRPNLDVLMGEVGGSFAVDGTFNGTTGEFSFVKARPGDYELQVIVGHTSVMKVPVLALLPGERRDLGTITLDGPGRIIVNATLPAGTDPGNVLCDVEEGTAHFTLDAGSTSTWTSGPLMPGDYTVMLASGSGEENNVFLLPAQAVVRVESGRDARVELVTERGVAQTIWILTQRDPPPKASLVVTDASGVELRRSNLSWGTPLHGAGSQAGSSFIGRPGPHRLRVESDGQILAELDVIVPAGVNIGPDVRVTLP